MDRRLERPGGREYVIYVSLLYIMNDGRERKIYGPKKNEKNETKRNEKPGEHWTMGRKMK